MVVFLGILAAAALGGIIYIFLSKTTSKLQKLAALIALILSGVALCICGAIIIFSGDAKSEDVFYLPDILEEKKTGSDNDVMHYIFYLVIIVLLMGFVIFAGMKDQKKNQAEKEVKKKSPPDIPTDDF